MPKDERRIVRIRKPKRTRLFEKPLGVQIEGRVSGREQWIDPNWNVQIHVKWCEVEAVQGTYDWSLYREDFRLLSGKNIIVGIKCVPDWARLWPSFAGTPPKAEFYPHLGAFVANLVTQFNPAALELFNEPDADQDDVKKGSVDFGEYFGCWVSNRNWAEGGRRYGECMKMVYPIVKDAHPQVNVLAGALIGEESSLTFISSAIKAGLKADGVTFHKYAHYGAGDERGAFKFASRLKRLTNLPLAMSETSLISKVDSSEFRQAQGSYLASLLTDFDNLGIDGLNWYSLADNGWMNADLVWEGAAQPAFDILGRGIIKKHPRPVIRRVKREDVRE